MNSHAHSRIQTHYLGSQAAADLRLILHGHLYQQLIYVMLKNTNHVKQYHDTMVTETLVTTCQITYHIISPQGQSFYYENFKWVYFTVKFPILCTMN